MTLIVPKQEEQQLEKLKSFTESVLPSFTGDMVQDMAEKAVKGIELADELLQPELLDLLRVLPEVSENLARTLVEIKKLEESGVFSFLFDLAQLVSNAKKALTGDMIFDMTEKVIAGVELADSFIQRGTIDIANQVFNAYENAKADREGKKPLTKMQLFKLMNQPETLDSLSFLLIFAQKFSNEMKK
ncbi:MAG TPA: hypothetical protein VJ546_12175 [Bacillales bacterium]|nr:hypothetical protein [Bacillales bacterium]